MNGFVDECRAEWRRLGVPATVADEMAVELAADLAEARAEGASAEDVLGASASDPRAFAAAWAAELGVIRQHRARHARRLLIAAAVAASALVAIAGAVLVVVSSPSESRRLAVSSPDGLVQVLPVAPDDEPRTVVFARIPSALPIPAPAPGLPMWVSAERQDSGFDARIPGLILLIAGLTGVLMLTSLGLLRASRPAV